MDMNPTSGASSRTRVAETSFSGAVLPVPDMGETGSATSTQFALCDPPTGDVRFGALNQTPPIEYQSVSSLNTPARSDSIREDLVESDGKHARTKQPQSDPDKVSTTPELIKLLPSVMLNEIACFVGSPGIANMAGVDRRWNHFLSGSNGSKELLRIVDPLGLIPVMQPRSALAIAKEARVATNIRSAALRQRVSNELDNATRDLSEHYRALKPDATFIARERASIMTNDGKTVGAPRCGLRADMVRCLYKANPDVLTVEVMRAESIKLVEGNLSDKKSIFFNLPVIKLLKNLWNLSYTNLTAEKIAEKRQEILALPASKIPNTFVAYLLGDLYKTGTACFTTDLLTQEFEAIQNAACNLVSKGHTWTELFLAAQAHLTPALMARISAAIRSLNDQTKVHLHLGKLYEVGIDKVDPVWIASEAATIIAYPGFPDESSRSNLIGILFREIRGAKRPLQRAAILALPFDQISAENRQHLLSRLEPIYRYRSVVPTEGSLFEG